MILIMALYIIQIIYFRALKNLSVLLNDVQNVNSVDRRIQHKVDNHWSQIAAQINRLKVFKVIIYLTTIA